MKILSITDVITNSSTEVFAIVHPDDVYYIKKVVNFILQLAGSDKTCDDILKIEYTWDEDELLEYMDENEMQTREEAIDSIEDDIDYGEYPSVFPDIVVTPLNRELRASDYEMIEGLAHMFAEHKEFNC